MRDSRDRWTFFQHPSRPTLSAADVQYWKTNLKKILKVGKEFEFNLPNATGSCKGNNDSCPCQQLEKNSCWQKCIYEATCSTVPSMECCENIGNSCTSEKCAKCSNYHFFCQHVHCTNFESKCFGCASYKVDCTTCKHRYDEKKNPANIRRNITGVLSPNNSYGTINKSGVHSITQDGSLLGDKGMEIITIGRRVDYWEFYKMAKQIIDLAIESGAYVNERCSIHMHLLASYYGKLGSGDSGNFGIPSKINEMERSMPEIILANFHQLCRRYQNAMTWMMMGLNEPSRMTRWEKFRVSVLEISPVTDTMQDVLHKVSHNSGGNKYGWVNYNNLGFDNDGHVSRFHVEMRAMDGIMCPSAVAAFACLYYALIIKAVEISRYGLLEIGSPEWMSQARAVKADLLNNMKHYSEGDRFGNTKKLSRHYDILIRESLDLVRQMKTILIKVGPAYQILEKLAERPIALRRCDGETWQDIEKALEVPMSNEDIFSTKVDEFIDLRLIDECKDIDEWITEVSKALSPNAAEPDKDIEHNIRHYVEALRNDGELIWSTTLGSVARL